jgi:transposase
MDEVLDAAGLDESAHTTGGRSRHSERLAIITRGERRRSWTLEQKRAIVAESLGPELTPTEVARKHAISSGLLYTWRRQLLNVPSTVVTRSVARFAEVDLVPSSSNTRAPAPIEKHAPSAPAAGIGGVIEIVLPGGRSLRVDAQVDGGALRRVLDALDRR